MPSPYTKKERRADLIDSPQICVFLTFVLDTPEQQNRCFAGRSSGGWQRTSAIGFSLPASFHKGCGWTEVSLSSLPVIALSWAARYRLPIGIALVFKTPSWRIADVADAFASTMRMYLMKWLFGYQIQTNLFLIRILIIPQSFSFRYCPVDGI